MGAPLATYMTAGMSLCLTWAERAEPGVELKSGVNIQSVDTAQHLSPGSLGLA